MSEKTFYELSSTADDVLFTIDNEEFAVTSWRSSEGNNIEQIKGVGNIIYAESGREREREEYYVHSNVLVSAPTKKRAL